MTRLTDPQNAALLARSNVTVCDLVQLDYASGTVRATNYSCDVEWNGHLWISLASIASIDPAREDVEIVAQPMRITVAGDPATVAKAIGESYQGRRAARWLAIIDASSGRPLAVQLDWEGLIDTQTIRLSERTGLIELNFEPRLQREPRHARYTDADQQSRYIGDLFFSHQGSIAGSVSLWGDERVRYSGGGGGNIDVGGSAVHLQ